MQRAWYRGQRRGTRTGPRPGDLGRDDSRTTRGTWPNGHRRTASEQTRFHLGTALSW